MQKDIGISMLHETKKNIPFVVQEEAINISFFCAYMYHCNAGLDIGKL